MEMLLSRVEDKGWGTSGKMPPYPGFFEGYFNVFSPPGKLLFHNLG